MKIEYIAYAVKQNFRNLLPFKAHCVSWPHNKILIAMKKEINSLQNFSDRLVAFLYLYYFLHQQEALRFLHNRHRYI